MILGKNTFVLLSLSILILGVCSGAFGQLYRFFIVTFLYLLGVFLLKYSPYKKRTTSILIYALPFFLLIGPAFLYTFSYKNFLNIPWFLGGLFGVVFAVKFSKYKTKTILFSLFVANVTLAIATYFLPNYYNYLGNKQNIVESKDLPRFIIYDESNKIVDKETFKGKITVIDVWASSCGVCIKKFPEFDKLKNEFKIDTTISFYSLNLPLKKDKREEVSKITKSFSFTKLYGSEQTKEKLKIELVPTYIILDKNSKIRYVGSFNTGSNEIYNNFYSIIKDLKNEK